MFCTKCGKQHNGNDIVCDECKSRELPSAQQSVQNTSTTGAKANGNSLVYIVVAVIAVPMIIKFLPFSSKSSSNSIKDITSSPYVSTGFTLDSYRAESYAIKGTVSANSWKDTKLAVEISFYDKNKSIIDTRYDYSPPLNPGDSWAFSVYIPSDSAYYKITRVAYTYYG